MDVLTPVIVSASRATDIPACYGEWLLRRLRAGSCVWVNRFNGQRQRVSLERTRVIVFWSKNPAPLLPRLGEIDALGINYYFTFTLNDYEREGLEPGVPPLVERIETFCSLSRLLGPERVVWRFDPIVVGRRLTPEVLLSRIARIGAAVHRHTRKLVISFADIERYPAARRRVGLPGCGGLREPGAEAIARIAAGIRELNRAWGLEIATCAETVDLADYGIGRNRCIDDELLVRAFPGDAALREFLGRGAGGGSGCSAVRLAESRTRSRIGGSARRAGVSSARTSGVTAPARTAVRTATPMRPTPRPRQSMRGTIPARRTCSGPSFKFVCGRSRLGQGFCQNDFVDLLDTDLDRAAPARYLPEAGLVEQVDRAFVRGEDVRLEPPVAVLLRPTHRVTQHRRADAAAAPVADDVNPHGKAGRRRAAHQKVEQREDADDLLVRRRDEKEIVLAIEPLDVRALVCGVLAVDLHQHVTALLGAGPHGGDDRGGIIGAGGTEGDFHCDR